MGSRVTVFPRAAHATLRGLARDADVVLEVVNGIAFCSPAWPWLRAPTVALVHHVHQQHYVTELGLRGRIAAVVAESCRCSCSTATSRSSRSPRPPRRLVERWA
jgi:hypothetical protein